MAAAPISFDANIESTAERHDEILKNFTDLDFTVRQISASLLIDAQLQAALASLATSAEPAFVSPSATSTARRRRTSSAAPMPLPASPPSADSEPPSEPDAPVSARALENTSPWASSTKMLPRGPSQIEVISVSATAHIATSNQSLLRRTFLLPLHVALIFLWCIGAMLVMLLTAPLPRLLTCMCSGRHNDKIARERALTLVDLSNFAQQLHRRLNEIAQWPFLYQRLQERRKYDEGEAAAFMRLFGSMARVAIDALIGCALLYWLLSSTSLLVPAPSYTSAPISDLNSSLPLSFNISASAVNVSQSIALSSTSSAPASEATSGASWLRAVLHHAGQLLHLDVLQACRTHWSSVAI